tara:strand:- start:1447 stop:1743 length:297 start_codon:yes stop_codon:yes gene_type:complete
MQKATNKEITNAIIEVNNKVERLFMLCKQLDGILGLYIEMKGDKSEIDDLIQKKYEEHDKMMKEKNDQAANGKPDKKDIPKDSGNKRSGAEGVRKGAN